MDHNDQKSTMQYELDVADHIESGQFVFNRLDVIGGYGNIIADINPDYSVSYRYDDLPDYVILQIEHIARRSMMTDAATRDSAFYSLPPDPAFTEQDTPEILARDCHDFAAILDPSEYNSIYAKHETEDEIKYAAQAMAQGGDGFVSMAFLNDTICELADDPEMTCDIETARSLRSRLASFMNNYAIYQIKEGAELRAYRFETLESLKAHGLAVNRDHYALVYMEHLTKKDTLDMIYQQFNTDLPTNFQGRSLSISDVIVIQKDGQQTAHYVDSYSFQEVPEFFSEDMRPRLSFTEVEPEKQYELGYGHMGNGLTVWNRLDEKDGDYVKVAHIDRDRSVTFYDQDMPEAVKEQIKHEARTSNMTVSVTQSNILRSMRGISCCTRRQKRRLTSLG